MTFSIHQGGEVLSCQITHAQSSNIHTLVHVVGTCDLISVLFTVYANRIMERHPTPLQVIRYQAREGSPKEYGNKAKTAAAPSIIYICTKALHSFLSLAYCHATCSVIHLLPEVTFTLCIQPNLGLPRNHPPLPPPTP